MSRFETIEASFSSLASDLTTWILQAINQQKIADAINTAVSEYKKDYKALVNSREALTPGPPAAEPPREPEQSTPAEYSELVKHLGVLLCQTCTVVQNIVQDVRAFGLERTLPNSEVNFFRRWDVPTVDAGQARAVFLTLSQWQGEWTIPSSIFALRCMPLKVRIVDNVLRAFILDDLNTRTHCQNDETVSDAVVFPNMSDSIYLEKIEEKNWVRLFDTGEIDLLTKSDQARQIYCCVLSCAQFVAGQSIPPPEPAPSA